jgi:hypothetical protein
MRISSCHARLNGTRLTCTSTVPACSLHWRLGGLSLTLLNLFAFRVKFLGLTSCLAQVIVVHLIQGSYHTRVRMRVRVAMHSTVSLMVLRYSCSSRLASPTWETASVSLTDCVSVLIDDAIWSSSCFLARSRLLIASNGPILVSSHTLSLWIDG